MERLQLYIFFFLVALSCIRASSDRRPHWCSGAGDKCYATRQCCSGYVCAAFDEFIDSHPESPGNCMKEKDLLPCGTSADCGAGIRCVPLGPNRERYCLARYPSQHHTHVPETGRESGDLGADCKTDKDCKETTDEGERLCCQVVTFFRRKPRKICDKIYYDTKCIL